MHPAQNRKVGIDGMKTGKGIHFQEVHHPFLVHLHINSPSVPTPECLPGCQGDCLAGFPCSCFGLLITGCGHILLFGLVGKKDLVKILGNGAL